MWLKAFVAWFDHLSLSNSDSVSVIHMNQKKNSEWELTLGNNGYNYSAGDADDVMNAILNFIKT
jgi:hypothetical protein